MTESGGSGEFAVFDLPKLQFNEDGWGPTWEVPQNFRDMPYQPFCKSDRMGKISDWTGNALTDKKFPNKYASQFGSGNQYAYYHDEDETTFHLVDTVRVTKPAYQRGRFRGNMRNMRNMRGRGGRGGGNSGGGPGGMTQMGRGAKLRSNRGGNPRHRGMRNQPPKMRDASVAVRNDWTVIEEMDFPRLSKLSMPNVAEPVDIMCCGTLEYYDKAYDRVNVKNERVLQGVDRIFHTVTTTDDPIIRSLTKKEGNVYATDTILATLMCCTRSNYSWDIVVQKIGDKLFMDKRDNTEFDLLTVNETSLEPPSDDDSSLNSPRNLAIEATFINHNFSQQVLKSGEPKFKFPHPNPFITDDEEGEVASVAYRYRKWDLGNGIILVARCEHDAVLQNQTGETQFLTVKALNEWDSKLASGVEWRQKLDTQRSAVLANELRNNACKLAKWTVQSLLAGSDQIKFGYVSRVNVRDSSRHVILGTQPFKPTEFATQINLNMDNAWGILRCIIDTCMKQKDGKYLILKDPNKPMVRLYDIPDHTFDTDDDEDGQEEGEFQSVYTYKSQAGASK